ncbi:MAG: VOC family protein [Deltaproteobacteria bacterium]|nr:VOC family protein [Deltaproteobacteria bacterium]
MVVKNGALGHIVLNVADLKKSENFYSSVLGLKVSARNKQTKMTFLSYGREHHDIALQALPRGAKHVGGKGMPKLHHFCIYVDSDDVIEKLYPVLKRRKIQIVSGPETLVVAGNRSISFADPDGNRVEIACNANKFKHDQRKK